jgi:hypothetical protein
MNASASTKSAPSEPPPQSGQKELSGCTRALGLRTARRATVPGARTRSTALRSRSVTELSVMPAGTDVSGHETMLRTARRPRVVFITPTRRLTSGRPGSVGNSVLHSAAETRCGRLGALAASATARVRRTHQPARCRLCPSPDSPRDRGLRAPAVSSSSGRAGVRGEAGRGSAPCVGAGVGAPVGKSVRARALGATVAPAAVGVSVGLLVGATAETLACAALCRPRSGGLAARGYQENVMLYGPASPW